ncbi:MAG: triose-phosphate isomerase [Bacteroidales bacterium]|jgi:triosephosphate isomerase|nr:triose-phosphate isomerase [Bacteroidales bacterium]MDD2263794.1 triose-phosphate isomerase [Bacteroidales bacterium]MDD2830988.1 triose-phosphate isomerase [Bacteroidales bacterium]MDD3208204.1 triose-phosphate isomerase [Bacteroidales bacterium]MDD3696754.1 triose-phosphate isomerase [Bacteroidales bacterium]
MREKIVAGNWKMNTSIQEGKHLAEDILSGLDRVPEGVTLIVAPPFTHLFPIACLIGARKNPGLAAQNCADRNNGAFTGEVSSSMLASVPCQYVILGHSERRQYYGETNQILLDKIKLALDGGLRPIFCVGEVLSKRESNLHFQIVSSQLREVLCQLDPDEFRKVIVAYEPVWAIGTGKTATSGQAQEMHAFIRAFLAESFGELAESTPILYGGSCKPSNAAEIFAQRDVDGGLIGGASLKADDFLAIAGSFARP